MLLSRSLKAPMFQVSNHYMLSVNIANRCLNLFNITGLFSVAHKGISNSLLKVGSKRRRTHAQIEHDCLIKYMQE